MWNEIVTEEDISGFMSMFGHFHDSCIKEIRYVSGAFVEKDLSMNPINDKRIVDMIFQRQYENPMAIAIRLSGLKVLHLVPCNDNYTCEIHEATVFFKNGYAYWVDCNIGTENELECYDGTWVCAKKIQWRIMDEYMGSNEIFKAKFE